MKKALTIFKHVYDNKTHRVMKFDSWDGLVNLFKQLSGIPGYKPRKDGIKPSSGVKPIPLISPSIYKENSTRANANVLGWGGWCALDIDDYEGDYLDAIRVFSNVKNICYSSASSTKEKPKFRMVLDLNRPLKAKEIQGFWYALDKKFPNLFDPQTKDASRMFYAPAKVDNAFNFFLENDGEPLNVDAIMNEFPFLPSPFSLKPNEKLQELMAEHKKSKLQNRSFTWTDHTDCPFVTQGAIKNYLSLDTGGWYHQLYKFMVSVAIKAVEAGYPMTAPELTQICRSLDSATGNWYKTRKIDVEAERALMYALQTV